MNSNIFEIMNKAVERLSLLEKESRERSEIIEELTDHLTKRIKFYKSIDKLERGYADSLANNTVLIEFHKIIAILHRLKDKS